MKQLKLIGVCLSTINEEDRFNFICGLNKYAVLSGYRLLIFNSCADLYEQSTANNEGSSAVFRLIPYDKLSALILFPNIMYDTGIVDEVVRNCHEHGVPIISIDKEMPGCISFAFSNADIFEKLCRHVIEDHGARKLFHAEFFPEYAEMKKNTAEKFAHGLRNWNIACKAILTVS